MQHTIQTDKIASLIYLWHYQATLGDLTREEEMNIDSMADDALAKIGYPPASSTVFDDDTEPFIKWVDEFSWPDYMLGDGSTASMPQLFRGIDLMEEWIQGKMETSDKLLELATKFAEFDT